jgi:hypothetical protein
VGGEALEGVDRQHLEDVDVTRTTRAGMWLLLLTAALVAVGCALWVAGYVGWAELLIVLASGTAGAGIVLFVERR